MATLYYSAFRARGYAGGSRDGIQVAQMPSLGDFTLVEGSTVATSAAFPAGTSYIRVHTDAICSVAISSSPIATTTFPRMPADATEYFGVSTAMKISVIANS